MLYASRSHRLPLPAARVLLLDSYRRISSHSLDLLLRQCSTSLQAKQVHAHLVVSSALHHHNSSFLSALLISAYSRLGLLRDAVSFFLCQPLHPPSSLVFNSILRAYLSHSQPHQALLVYRSMKSHGVVPDGFTLPLVIRGCSGIGAHKLSISVHGHAVTVGYQTHLHVANELTLMYGNMGQMDFAGKVFDAMPIRNVVSWNVLISGYALNHEWRNTCDVFQRMKVSGIEPSPVTWTSLLSAHARCRRRDDVLQLFDEMRMRGCKATAEAAAVALSVCAFIRDKGLDKGKEIHGFCMKDGFDGYSFVRNALVCMYGKLGCMEDAKALFSETEFKNLVSWNALISSYASAGFCDEAYEVFSQMEKSGEFTPNLVSWSAVIGGYASCGMVEKSMELFREMVRANVVPNSITIATVLSACAELSALHSGREIHGYSIRGLLDKDVLVGNGLLNMFTKSGNQRCGRLVFDRLEDKDLISWNTMITGYGMHGLCDEALITFAEMVQDGIEPDGITFVAILSACSHAGRVSEGREMFDRMLHEYKFSPWMEHYACMVDLLGRAGLLREASKLVETMPMKPNACVWGALLNSCRIYGNTAMAEETAMRVLGLEVEGAGNYMLLSNIFSASGNWKEAAKMRVLTKAKGLKKNPGQSWIEVKKKVFVFSSGSALPDGADEVYGVVKDLNRLMEIEKLSSDYEDGFCD